MHYLQLLVSKQEEHAFEDVHRVHSSFSSLHPDAAEPIDTAHRAHIAELQFTHSRHRVGRLTVPYHLEYIVRIFSGHIVSRNHRPARV